MELILKQDVQNLGFKDDVVNVKNGYGRNFLIPQGFASLATPSAKKVLAENLKQRAHKEAKIVNDVRSYYPFGLIYYMYVVNICFLLIRVLNLSPFLFVS
jgi:hypothetical protein